MEQWEIEQNYQGLINDFYYNKLKFCGCGRPDFTLGFIKNILNTIKEKTDGYDKPTIIITKSILSIKKT